MEPVTLVIPTFNEAETIGAAIREIPAAYRLNIIVADGGSTDGTPRIARVAGARVVNAGRGYGRACALGAEKAHPASTVIAFMDGDGADRGDLIDEIARPVLDGAYDLVLASRTRGEREPGAMLWHQVLAGRIAGFGCGAYCIHVGYLCCNADRMRHDEAPGGSPCASRPHAAPPHLDMKCVDHHLLMCRRRLSTARRLAAACILE